MGSRDWSWNSKLPENAEVLFESSIIGKGEEGMPIKSHTKMEIYLYSNIIFNTRYIKHGVASSASDAYVTPSYVNGFLKAMSH